MSKLPDAIPCPDGPPLHLKGGYLCVASPVEFTEACFSVPAVRALKRFRPHSTMAVMCPESQLALWETMSELDGLITYPDGASARQIVRVLADCDTTFESAVVWEAGEAAKALARRGVLQRLGYPAAGLEKYLTDVVAVASVPGPVEHRVRHYLNFVDKLGADAFVRENFKTPGLSPPPEKLQIVIAPVSEFGSAYEWPVERFKEVVDQMDARYPDIGWIILGAAAVKDKTDLCSDLEDLLAGRAEDFSKIWDQSKVIQSLSSSSALLACDGELAHAAAHVGLPAAVVFGPNEPEWKRPLGKQSMVIRQHVACSPCFLARCPLDHRCQDEVTVEMVVAGLESALKLRYGA